MARCSRPVLKGGRMQPVALAARHVAGIVKHYAELAGLALGQRGEPQECHAFAAKVPPIVRAAGVTGLASIRQGAERP
jgi:hypothetical protein